MTSLGSYQPKQRLISRAQLHSQSLSLVVIKIESSPQDLYNDFTSIAPGLLEPGVG